MVEWTNSSNNTQGIWTD